ncbi:MAG: HlyD family efflux transporter periplasmic adaptor subunit [Acidobacteria bacterium]|nr:HlyD family efflux transporter periplasmic adaptor subunit [Acidobacteriota bacterium]
MDIAREGVSRRKWSKRIAWSAAAALIISGAALAIARLKPAAISLDAASLLIDTVKRGPLVIQHRGLGVLVPEEFMWLPAVTDGRVEKIHIRPGAAVRPESVILTLSNPELNVAALEAGFLVKAAEAKYRDLEVQLKSQRFALQAELARIESESVQAKLKADRDEQLFQQQLLADLNLRLSVAAAEEWSKRLALERERLAIQRDASDAQLAVQRAEIEKLQALAQLKRDQVAALAVRAGAVGVLQELSVQEGQRIAAGSILAKVAQPAKLKAELRIPETQAKDLVLGQSAQIDTRNGIVAGHVVRIDPAAKEGTVLVDVRLDGPLPPGARPDLSVDGTIEVERLPDVLYTGRPAFGQPGASVTLFRLAPAGDEAARLPVRLGRASVNFIEIRGGLAAGDRVILSDTPTAEGQERILLRR